MKKFYILFIIPFILLFCYLCFSFNSGKISSAKGLEKLFTEGGEGSVTKSFSLDKPLYVKKDAVLNLNGKTISAVFPASGDSEPAAFTVSGGSALTIDDTEGGSVRGGSLFRVDSSSVDVRGGSFFSGKGSIFTIAGRGSAVVIEGGVFEGCGSDEKPGVFAFEERSEKDHSFCITGGRFNEDIGYLMNDTRLRVYKRRDGMYEIIANHT